jgi:antitoxin component YwqK of YwqJK toxin-antitoxin module
MKKLNILIVLLYSCTQQQKELHEPTIPQVFILKSSKNISNRNDTVFVENKKYSGFLYELYPNSKDTFSVESYHDGLLSGVQKKWYSNKKRMEERHYCNGQKNGKQVAFWGNDNKKFEFIAKNDTYEGELREWTVEGRLFHLATFSNGQEDGSQKMWYDNGKIRANYVMIKGKRYGLLGTKNCKNVSDSIFVVK